MQEFLKYGKSSPGNPPHWDFGLQNCWKEMLSSKSGASVVGQKCSGQLDSLIPRVFSRQWGKRWPGHTRAGPWIALSVRIWSPDFPKMTFMTHHLRVSMSMGSFWKGQHSIEKLENSSRREVKFCMSKCQWSIFMLSVAHQVKGKWEVSCVYFWFVNLGKDARMFECPIYRKPARTELNYIGSIDFESDIGPRHWVMRGVALLCDIK